MTLKDASRSNASPTSREKSLLLLLLHLTPNGNQPDKGAQLVEDGQQEEEQGQHPRQCPIGVENRRRMGIDSTIEARGAFGLDPSFNVHQPSYIDATHYSAFLFAICCSIFPFFLSILQSSEP
ncbi:hypothetical protein RIF29_28161 [Crotalaria pallida]|uniref:Uncharacterized protein n=1 Tax=Crotalaria pallida TaxID=3830 RepID=A0AAN9ERF0_CROPI